MNIKMIGFALAAIGMVLIFIATPNMIKIIPGLNQLDPSIIKYIIITGIICVGMGIILVMSTAEGKKHAYHHKTKMGEEVPIFHNKEIIGYRITK
ncbi:hypothetical protein J4218_05525 [Candidatus Pacearchaeota archaeon]|nr:hypothetical protein [Candidatus Pacearchaeota archaeon]